LKVRDSGDFQIQEGGTEIAHRIETEIAIDPLSPLKRFATF